ncbi:MAG TPA: DUF1501 domain-containing protein [Kofleriaceae bacterium]
MSTRRDFVKLALGTGAWLVGCGSKKAPKPEPVAGPTKPRHWVQILLSGGHDTVYTTDPKRDQDVDQIVTLPAENRIVPAGELSFGPHFAPLARWGSELTVLNGVQVRTVNHDTGQKQFFHLKTNISDVMPSALDIIATRRPKDQPLGVAYINLSSRTMHSPAYFGTADRFYFGEGDVFDQVARTKPEELRALAKVYRKRAGALGRSSREAEQTAVYMREVGDFFEHAAEVPAMVAPERSTDYVAQSMAESLERALWLIEHDLCCGVVLDLGLLGWDTHIRNESKQGEMNGNFARFFDDYLSELKTRRNDHGSLADQTVTIVGSELGRFPHQNDMLGKDHLPQTSFLFAGPGLHAGKSFGRTGKRMEGLPIAYKNGAPAASGRVPFLDDVGATMLHLAGIDPERYGYSGQVCEFLLDGSA